MEHLKDRLEDLLCTLIRGQGRPYQVSVTEWAGMVAFATYFNDEHSLAERELPRLSVGESHLDRRCQY
jgi:hypothetical protein